MTRHLDPDRRRPAPPHPGYDHRELDVDMEVCRWCAALVPADERQRVKHEEWDQRIAGRFLGLFDAVGQLSAAVTQLANQLSDLGSSGPTGVAGDAAPGSPRSASTSSSGGPGKALGGDPTSGAEVPGEREPRGPAQVLSPSAPDPTSGEDMEAGTRTETPAGQSSPGPTSEAEVRPERTSLAPQGRVGASASDQIVPTPPHEVSGFGHPNRDGVADANHRTQPAAAGLPPSGGTTTPAAVPPAAGVANRRPGSSRREEPGRLPLTIPEPPDDRRFAQ